ncbi:MAG TPA: neutral zinc metallopeptidase [Usitatibacter sp.]|nr:neutral zinc metallopeptidase [Usitatibacter sp.]
MELGDQRASENVEDRRGMGIGPIGGGIGVGGLVIVVVATLLGYDPRDIINVMQDTEQAPQAQVQQAPHGTPADAMGTFVAKVLGSTEDVWGQIFQNSGRTYRKPTLVLYTGGTRTGCGVGQAAMGPFYCPNDEKVYIDLAFYEDLRRRFHAPGDFAQAYVIAHEVGHHVQKLTGTFAKLQAAPGGGAGESGTSVRMELQADCYAGVWGHFAQAEGLLDAGDAEQAITAATAIGDDRLQRQSQGYVVPDSFTHGSSAQRVKWFKRGMESGRVRDCDTFSTRDL